MSELLSSSSGSQVMIIRGFSAATIAAFTCAAWPKFMQTTIDKAAMALQCVLNCVVIAFILWDNLR